MDTSLLAECSGDKVLIRATRNSFTERGKINFIHQLASEGFIPDQYQWLPNLNSARSNVRWQVDDSWHKIPEAATLCARKFMLGLMASAVSLWFGLMLALLHGWR